MKIFEIFKIQACHWLPCEILSHLVFSTNFSVAEKVLNYFYFQTRGLFSKFRIFLENPGGHVKILFFSSFFFFLTTEGREAIAVSHPPPSATMDASRSPLPPSARI